MNALFAFHKLNGTGQIRAQAIAKAFDELLMALESSIGQNHINPAGERERAIMRTKLEESCFYAKKAMALKAENQETPVSVP